MATLVRDRERLPLVGRPAEQLALSAGGTVATPGRGRGRGAGGAEPRREGGGLPLSERLRAERGACAGGSAVPAGIARGGGATLDELLVGAWEGLSARRPVPCPVCAGPMQPRAGAHGGGCGDCGAQVS